MCVVHLLLPIERGFPVLRVADIPLVLPCVVAIAAATYLFIESRGQLLTLFARQFSLGQISVVVALSVASVRAVRPTSGLAIALFYMSTFVIDYVVLTYLLERGHRKALVNIIVAVGVVAASIGIIHSLMGIDLSFYDYFADEFRRQQGWGENIQTLRSAGTLGNAIIYAVAMMLLIPFTYELRSPILSSLATAACLTAAATTLSRTAALVGVPLLCGVLGKTRRRGAVLLLIGGLVWAGVVVTISTNALADDSIRAAWMARLNGREALENSDVRQAAARAVVDWVWTTPSPLTLIFGQGLSRGSELASHLGARMDTIDNVYLGLLYETGLLGLLLFVGSYLRLLQVTWCRKGDRLHWFAVIGWLGAGLAFVSIYYSTFNFLIVASIAVLTARLRSEDERSRFNVRQIARRPVRAANTFVRG
jgi:hypothetical protein